MCSGLFSSSAKRAKPARHASARGLPTSNKAVWSDWTMSGLSEVKQVLLAGVKIGVETGVEIGLQIDHVGVALARRLRPPDPGKHEVALVPAQPAPGVDAGGIGDDGLDLPRGLAAVPGDVLDLHDHPFVGGALDHPADIGIGV